jgi:hypothetical protein
LIGGTADSDCILIYIHAYMYVCMHVYSHQWCTFLSIFNIICFFPSETILFRLIFMVIMDWHLQEFYKIVILYINIYEVLIWYFPILWLKLILICFYDTPNPKFSCTSSVQNSMFYVLLLKCCHSIFIVLFLLQVSIVANCHLTCGCLTFRIFFSLW